MACELSGRSVTQSAVRTDGIVVVPPRLHNVTGCGQAREPVLVETLVPKAPVEALDVGVLHRLARINEVQTHPVLVGPGIHRPPRELWPIVDHDQIRQAPFSAQPVQDPRNPETRERGIDLGGQALPGVVVNHRFTPDENKAVKRTFAREKRLITSGKSDPGLAQELEKERARLSAEAGKRGPRKPKTNRRTLTPTKGDRSHGKSEYVHGKAMIKKKAGAHALPGLVVRR